MSISRVCRNLSFQPFLLQKPNQTPSPILSPATPRTPGLQARILVPAHLPALATGVEEATPARYHALHRARMALLVVVGGIRLLPRSLAHPRLLRVVDVSHLHHQFHALLPAKPFLVVGNGRVSQKPYRNRRRSPSYSSRSRTPPRRNGAGMRARRSYTRSVTPPGRKARIGNERRVVSRSASRSPPVRRGARR